MMAHVEQKTGNTFMRPTSAFSYDMERKEWAKCGHKTERDVGGVSQHVTEPVRRPTSSPEFCLRLVAVSPLTPSAPSLAVNARLLYRDARHLHRRLFDRALGPRHSAV